MAVYVQEPDKNIPWITRTSSFPHS